MRRSPTTPKATVLCRNCLGFCRMGPGKLCLWHSSFPRGIYFTDCSESTGKMSPPADVGCFSCFAFCSTAVALQLLLQMMPCLAKALPQCHPKKLEGSSPSRKERHNVRVQRKGGQGKAFSVLGGAESWQPAQNTITLLVTAPRAQRSPSQPLSAWALPRQRAKGRDRKGGRGLTDSERRSRQEQLCRWQPWRGQPWHGAELHGEGFCESKLLLPCGDETEKRSREICCLFCSESLLEISSLDRAHSSTTTSQGFCFPKALLVPTRPCSLLLAVTLQFPSYCLLSAHPIPTAIIWNSLSTRALLLPVGQC